MKTLTITISEKAARNLKNATAGGPQTIEEAAAKTIEAAFADDWGDLDEEDIAAIEEGLKDLERGATVPHEEVVADMKRKYGW